MSLAKEIKFTINGSEQAVTIPVSMNAVTLIRDVLKLSGTKIGCGEGECGACTILVDGESVNSCLMFAVEFDGREITTVEGIQKEDGSLSDLQDNFVKEWATQCGFCTPGMIMQGTYMVNKNQAMSREEIARGIEGNICRCTGYKKIIDAMDTTINSNVETDVEKSMEKSHD